MPTLRSSARAYSEPFSRRRLQELELKTIRKLWRVAGRSTTRIDQIIAKVESGSFFEDPRKLGRLLGFTLEDYDAYRNRPRQQRRVPGGKYRGRTIQIRRKWPSTIAPYDVTPKELGIHQSSVRLAQDAERRRRTRAETAKRKAEEQRLEEEQRRSDEEFYRANRASLAPRSAAIYDLLSFDALLSVAEITDAMAYEAAFTKPDGMPLSGHSLKVTVLREIDKLKRAKLVLVKDTTVSGRVVERNVMCKGGPIIDALMPFCACY